MNANPYSASEQQTSGGNQSLGPKFDQQVRVMQVIAAALMMGVLTFLFVVLMLTQGDVLRFADPKVLSLFGVGFGFLMIIAHFVIPGIISAGHIQRAMTDGLAGSDDTSRSERLIMVYQTQMIIGLALLEGAAFLNLVMLMQERNGLNLVAAILLLGLMLSRFPARTKVLWWIQDRLRDV